MTGRPRGGWMVPVFTGLLVLTGCATAPAAEAHTLRVMTYNIFAGNDLERRSNHARVAALIDSLAVDVVFLQEVDRRTARSGDVDQAAVLGELTGLQVVFGRSMDFDSGEYGNAILTRLPVVATRVQPYEPGMSGAVRNRAYEPRSIMHVTVTAPSGVVHLVNTHLDHQAEPVVRHAQMLQALAYLAEAVPQGESIILGGDLNAQPGAHEIRALALHFTDSWLHCGDGDGFTFRSDLPSRRIDYILLAGLQCDRAWVPDTQLSDHRPVVVDVRLPPRTASAPVPVVRAVVISDLNAAYGSTHYPQAVHAVMQQIIRSWRPDVVLAAGDLIAGQAPQLPDSAVRAMWAAFDSAIAAPLRAAGIPLIATLGNHDASAYATHARDRSLAVEHLRAAVSELPFVDSTHYPLRHAVQYGHVFVAAWDGTRQESGTDAELLHWLQRVLSTPEARRARHRVVLSHLPLYGVAVGRDRPGEVLAAGDSVRRLLEDWGATLFISGHQHAYFPGRRGQLELLHAGALGNGPRVLVGTDGPPRRTVSVLDFMADSLAMTTYFYDDDTGALEPLPLETLPRAICGSTGRVVRRDLTAPDTACARPQRHE